MELEDEEEEMNLERQKSKRQKINHENKTDLDEDKSENLDVIHNTAPKWCINLFSNISKFQSFLKLFRQRDLVTLSSDLEQVKTLLSKNPPSEIEESIQQRHPILKGFTKVDMLKSMDSKFKDPF